MILFRAPICVEHTALRFSCYVYWGFCTLKGKKGFSPMPFFCAVTAM